MTSEERLGLLPELITLVEGTEIPSPSTDLERPAKGSSDEGLTAKELGEGDFESHSG